MYKKAQESRLDMVVWYCLCLFVMILAIGTLYSFGMFSENEYLGTETITGAVVGESVEDGDFENNGPAVLEITNSSDNKSIIIDS